MDTKRHCMPYTITEAQSRKNNKIPPCTYMNGQFQNLQHQIQVRVQGCRAVSQAGRIQCLQIQGNTIWPFLTKQTQCHPAIKLPVFNTKGLKPLFPHQNLHVDVCNSFIPKCWNLEVIKRSPSRWVVHPNNELLFTANEEWLPHLWKTPKQLNMHATKS